MSEVVLTALITGGLSLAGVIVTVLVGNSKTTRDINHKLELHQAVTDTKLDELTREVRAHNNFAQRMPVVEQEIRDITKTMDKLQGYHME